MADTFPFQELQWICQRYVLALLVVGSSEQYVICDCIGNGLPAIGFQSVGLPAAIEFQSARTHWPLVLVVVNQMLRVIVSVWSLPFMADTFLPLSPTISFLSPRSRRCRHHCRYTAAAASASGAGTAAVTLPPLSLLPQTPPPPPIPGAGAGNNGSRCSCGDEP